MYQLLQFTEHFKKKLTAGKCQYYINNLKESFLFEKNRNNRKSISSNSRVKNSCQMISFAKLICYTLRIRRTESLENQKTENLW
ncbi:hypothetical protein BpHYR1_048506 [Brachionus plicatilis]|uniref:Uncharacterized protein n=1 Tax=Brachionus plicatilis TaxID=10195 RepID=A0A3M7SCM1_BRAPC|nr:hypothetical protein BpHYR1_048506 [Brachionus plicatilis]